VFEAWQWNGFIFGPVLSTLVAYDNQDMIDKACNKVGNIDQETYYSLSWMVLASMILNGAVARSGQIVQGVISQVTTTSTVTVSSILYYDACLVSSIILLLIFVFTDYLDNDNYN
jgi:hypothetical protein